MKITESFVHVAMRQYLKSEGWQLIAGEYPGGSDDELYVLSIMDPEVARDNSPDPRRHSEGEIIPDLFAFKDGTMLVIEAKPKYSFSDKEKLRELIDNKRELLISSLRKFCYEHDLLVGVQFDAIRFVPVLAFGNEQFLEYSEEKGFAHLYVKTLTKSRLIFF